MSAGAVTASQDASDFAEAERQYEQYVRLAELARASQVDHDRPVYFAPLPAPMTLSSL